MTNDKLSFEKAMDMLETIVEELESGELTLDSSLKEFEKAVSLIKLCNDKIESAKQTIKILTEGDGGEICEMPFDDNK